MHPLGRFASVLIPPSIISLLSGCINIALRLDSAAKMCLGCIFHPSSVKEARICCRRLRRLRSHTDEKLINCCDLFRGCYFIDRRYDPAGYLLGPRCLWQPLGNLDCWHWLFSACQRCWPPEPCRWVLQRDWFGRWEA
jgi:hypothetical protein